MKYMWELAESMGIKVTHIDTFREYGTDRWSEQEYDIDRDHESYTDTQQMFDANVKFEAGKRCDQCGRHAPRVYPVHCTEVDPTHVDGYWCRDCVNGVTTTTATPTSRTCRSKGRA